MVNSCGAAVLAGVIRMGGVPELHADATDERQAVGVVVNDLALMDGHVVAAVAPTSGF